MSPRICTASFHVTALSLDVKPGDPLRIERENKYNDTALVHFGGMLRAWVTRETLLRNSREADPDELKKELRQCARCNRIELEGRWIMPPSCFTPRIGVTLVPHNCPECDS